MTNQFTSNRRPGVIAIAIAMTLAGSVLLGACDKLPEPKPPMPAASAAPVAHAKQAELQLTHVHGLSYDLAGNLHVPSHHGLARFDGIGWAKAAGPEHDYMGFAITRDSFFTSGHPAPGSALVNPFGLMKSGDGGKTWDKRGLEGETDFHLLAAGYETNVIYVLNPATNSKMKSAGLHFTADAGNTWKHAAARGLEGSPIAIGVHPANARMLAIGTDRGLYLSQDGGEAFARLAPGTVSAVMFDLNGRHLWFSAVAAAPELTRLALSGNSQKKIGLPKLSDDAVLYIAQNPLRRNEYTFATAQRSVYVGNPDLNLPDAHQRDTEAEAAKWKPIALKGETRQTDR